MKKILIVLFMMIGISALGNNVVFVTNGKDNFDKLAKHEWRNKLELAEIKKIKNTWYLVFGKGQEKYKIYSLNNGVFYINNPYTNKRNYYGYNTAKDELWLVEECDEGWCLADVPFQKF